MAEPLTVLVAARDEEASIARTVASLRERFPDAEVIVADDGSHDATAERAEEAGAIVLRLRRLGKGQALSAAERAAPPGRLLLCDADLEGELGPLLDGGADLAVAAFSEGADGGFGIAKAIARLVVRARTGLVVREPLSGQRRVSAGARAAAFPLAPGFGCEVRMTIDVARHGLRIEEIDLPLHHRSTGRDLHGFLHRGRQLLPLQPDGEHTRVRKADKTGQCAGIFRSPQSLHRCGKTWGKLPQARRCAADTCGEVGGRTSSILVAASPTKRGIFLLQPPFSL